MVLVVQNKFEITVRLGLHVDEVALTTVVEINGENGFHVVLVSSGFRIQDSTKNNLEIDQHWPEIDQNLTEIEQ